MVSTNILHSTLNSNKVLWKPNLTFILTSFVHFAMESVRLFGQRQLEKPPTVPFVMPSQRKCLIVPWKNSRTIQGRGYDLGFQIVIWSSEVYTGLSKVASIAILRDGTRVRTMVQKFSQNNASLNTRSACLLASSSTCTYILDASTIILSYLPTLCLTTFHTSRFLSSFFFFIPEQINFTHCSKSSFFVQKFNFDFSRKLLIF